MAPRSGLSLILCFTIVAAMLVLHADATSKHVTLPRDIAPGLPQQQAYLRGNTNAPSSMKKAAVVTEEMHVGDPSWDAIFGDYRDGSSPSANCKRSRQCRP